MSSVQTYGVLLASAHPADRRRLALFAFSTLIVVAAALAAHMLYEYNHLSSEKFSLNRDHGYAEIVQYILVVIAAVALVTIAHARRQAAYALLSAMMAYLFADDVFCIHEKVGEFLALNYPLMTPFDVEPAHAGEALYLGAVASIFLILLVILFAKASSKTRIDIAAFTALLILAGVFGIVGDVAHAAIGNKPAAMIEDGGELISVALLSIFSVDRALASSRNGAFYD
ncbi:MAG: hypothetical protein AAFX54_04605 [Pseudomonadota bacterium]